MSGRLIAIVGPSGVGKDSIISGMLESDPNLKTVVRVITRPTGSGGEDFVGVTEKEFRARKDAGEFCLSWPAHGLHYGIPKSALHDVEKGADRLINLSRAVLIQAARVFPAMIVLNLTATPETLAKRLLGRGRETPEDISARLSRTVAPLDPGLDVRDVANNGALEDAVQAALDAINR